MKRTAVLLLVLLIARVTFSQKEETVKLIGQSPDGKTMKMIWFLKTWDASIKGFDLKRRIAKSNNWNSLNATPIVPELSTSKDLSNVDPDVAEQTRLKQKLQKLVQNGKAHEIKSEDYLKRLSTDANALASVAMVTGLDFDMALLNGFGMVDRNIPAGGDYEYGLFSTGSSKPLATMTWKYGQLPELNIITNITSKSTAIKTKIQVLWTTDKEKTAKAMLAGFNLYKNNTKLNERPLMAVDDAALSRYTFFDSIVTRTENTKYEIAAQSIFGIEGPKIAYVFNPSEHPLEYKIPASISAGQKPDENSGIDITWNFETGQEMYLKGFRIEKNDMPHGYKVISDILTPASRIFNDKTYSTPANYIRYRVVAVFKDGTEASSNEILFYYAPNTKPPRPMNVKGKVITENNQTYVQLTWDPVSPSDSLTDFYEIYASNPVNGKFMLESSTGPIRENGYKYKIDYGRATKYKFGVSPVSKYMVNGPLSDTVTVMTPSKDLPFVIINNISLDSNHVVISWTYPEIWDIKGFRVYQNGNLVAPEFEVKKTSREFRTPGLKWGATYDFMVQAVTESGVESKKSIPASIIVQPVKRN